DALADTVGPAAKNDDLLAISRLGLTFVFVRGVHVGRRGREFRCARINALVYRADTHLMTQLANFRFGCVEQIRQTTIRETTALEFTHRVVFEIRQGLLLERQLNVDNLLDLRKEPRIDLGELMNVFQAEALGERITFIPDTLRTRLAEFNLQFFAVGRHLVKAVHPYFQPAQGLLERFLEGAADG